MAMRIIQEPLTSDKERYQYLQRASHIGILPGIWLFATASGDRNIKMADFETGRANYAIGARARSKDCLL